MTGRTRLKFCTWAFVVNCAIFSFAIYQKADLTATGVGLSMLNAPVLAYVLGDTIRPSNNDEVLT